MGISGENKTTGVNLNKKSGVELASTKQELLRTHNVEDLSTQRVNPGFDRLCGRNHHWFNGQKGHSQQRVLERYEGSVRHIQNTVGHPLHPNLSPAVSTTSYHWTKIDRDEMVRLTTCAILPHFNPSQAQVMSSNPPRNT